MTNKSHFARCWVLLLFVGVSLSQNTSVVNVFSMGESGYYCIKIPSLLATSNGTLLAFGEGRRYSCSDYAWTDLVYKRSFDGGNTWTSLQILYSNSSSKENFNVIGNAAPVQDRTTGRIIIPFCRNNLEVWLIYSDNDGYTWSKPKEIQGVTKHDWHWVGTGPPSSLQLSSGRIITPSYHSPGPHYTDGEVTHSHIMYSDDGGGNWELGAMFSGPFLTSECQAIQFPNETIFINARGLLTKRIQAISNDNGDSVENVQIMPTLIEPLGGCEGSTIFHPLNNWVFYSGPNNPLPQRYNMTVFISKDLTNTWDLYKVIDEGRSAYSSMAILPNNNVVMLYERSNLQGFIFVPQHISFLPIWNPNQ